MKRACLLFALVLACGIGCCKPKMVPLPIGAVPAEPVLETAALPETATPEQTQETQTRDLVRWVGYARELRELLRPFEAKPKPAPKKEPVK